MRPRRLAATIPMILALAAPARAQPADAGVLVEAERAFAADVAALGMRDGFLAHLADDGIVFQLGPVDAVPFYEAREPGPALLEWVPAWAEISAAGDLGWTTGPWTYRAEPGGDVVAGGHYVSLWREGEDRTRRVALDVGIAHAPPSLAGVEAETRTLRWGPDVARDPKTARTALEKADRDFAAAAAEDLAGAYRAAGAPDLRVYRMGAEPAVGLEPAADAAAAFGPLRWTLAGARVSSDGALGYAWGTALVEGGAEAGYLRIWRRRPDEGWALALDQSTAVPPPPADPAE